MVLRKGVKMKIDRRSTAAPVELRENQDGAPTIRGYAAKFYRSSDPGTEYELWKGARERIMPGAFDKAIQGDDVRGLFNHDPNMLLGRSKAGTLKLEVDEVGLRYEIQPADTSVYKDVVEYLRRGDVDGSSFQFSVPQGGEEWRMEGGSEIRELREVKLYDVGPVTFPAYKSATSGVRSMEDCDEAKERRDDWRKEMEKERELLDRQLCEIYLRGIDV
jgi:HK97 family phage prohead protease